MYKYLYRYGIIIISAFILYGCSDYNRILDKDGWPEGLSDKANKAIWLIIDYSDIDFQEKYLPYIESKAEFATIR